MTPPVISRFNPLGSSSISSSSSSSSSSTMTLTTTSKPSPPAGCIFVHPASPMEQQPFKPAENLNHNRSLSGSLPYIRPPATVNYSNTLFRSMSASSNQNISKPTSNNIQRPPYHQKTQSESGKSSPISFVNCKPMIRKKSGEPLRSSLKSASLSPSSSANSQLPTPPNQTPIPKSDLPQVWDQKLNSTSKSAPATPSSGTKFVHFDSHLEHVRHFLSQQRPIAVSRDQSPVETETEGEEEFPFPVMIKMVNQRSGMDGTVTSSSSSDEQASSLSHPRLIELPNIDKSSCTSDLVKLRSLELVKSGREIKGEVKVRNISYEKVVAARFTFDDWRTVSEVTGDFDKAIDNDYDQFVFSIRIHDGVGLAALKGAGKRRQMWLAIRYRAAGQEWWDNNCESNYLISIGSGGCGSDGVTASGLTNQYFNQRLNFRNSIQQRNISEHRRSLDDSSPSNLNSTLPSSADQSPRHNRCGSEPIFKTGVKESSVANPRMAELREKLNQLVGDDLGITSPSSRNSPPSLNALTATTQLKAGGSGLSARYDFGLSLRRAQLVPRPSNDGFPTRKNAESLQEWVPSSPTVLSPTSGKGDRANCNNLVASPKIIMGQPVVIKSVNLPPSPPEDFKSPGGGIDGSASPIGAPFSVQASIPPLANSGFYSPQSIESPVILGFDAKKGMECIGMFDQSAHSFGFGSFNNGNRGNSPNHHYQVSLFESTSASFL
ncbi:putative phosphatase regulatory subunit-domain-containing protein [Phakopsora pachyrhizi]|nr:putative phosphatase regulatory subunit-domain-containing protein [Phakopsora pachyrhizi]